MCNICFSILRRTVNEFVTVNCHREKMICKKKYEEKSSHSSANEINANFSDKLPKIVHFFT